MAPVGLALDVAADIDRDAHQPGLQAPSNIEAVDVLEGPEKDFLRGVLRIVDATQDPDRESHDSSFVTQDHLLKGSAVPFKSPSDQDFDFECFRPGFIFRSAGHQQFPHLSSYTYYCTWCRFVDRGFGETARMRVTRIADPRQY